MLVINLLLVLFVLAGCWIRVDEAATLGGWNPLANIDMNVMAQLVQLVLVCQI
jgi:hypothetical protein